MMIRLEDMSDTVLKMYTIVRIQGSVEEEVEQVVAQEVDTVEEL